MPAAAILIAMLITAAASTAFSAYSAHEQANAREAEVKAQEDALQAEAEETDRRRQQRLRQILGQQRAHFGALGIPSASGSAAALAVETVASASAEQAADERLTGIEQSVLRGRRQQEAFQRGLIPVAAGLQFASEATSAAMTYRALRQRPSAGGTSKATGAQPGAQTGIFGKYQ